MRKIKKEDIAFSIMFLLHLVFYALLIKAKVAWADILLITFLDGLVMLFLAGVVKHRVLQEAPCKVGLIVGHPLVILILIVIFVFRQIDKLFRKNGKKTRQY